MTVLLGLVSSSIALGYQTEAPKEAPPAEAKTPEPASPPAAPAEPAKPCCENQKEVDPADALAPPPCSCPISPFYTLPSGTVYYASRFATNCNDTPTAAYVFGNYSWPILCPSGNCLPSKRAAPVKGCELENKGEFPGFKAPFDRNYEHSMPSSKARQFSRLLISDPEPEFISFLDFDGNPRWAKVFAYKLDVQGAHATLDAECAGDPNADALRTRTIYVAVEIEKEVDGEVKEPEGLEDFGNAAVALNIKSEPAGTRSYVYRVTYTSSSGEPVSILILCAR
jgi:hypothetical protein